MRADLNYRVYLNIWAKSKNLGITITIGWPSRCPRERIKRNSVWENLDIYRMAHSSPHILLFFAVCVSIAYAAEAAAGEVSLSTVLRSGLTRCTLEKNGCYKSCTTFCALGRCSTSCSPECFQKGCKAKMQPTCTPTCTGSGNCYRRCSKCCTPDGRCISGICPTMCYPPGCGLAPTQKPTCTWICKAPTSGTCYARCQQCCNAKGICTLGACYKACYPPVCGVIPSMYKCAWKCVITGGGCYKYCRN